MKDFKQFNKEVNEAAALVTALPKIAGIATKVAPKLPKIAKFASGALKFGTAIPVQVPLGLGVAKVLQSTGDGESNFEKLRDLQKKGEAEDLSQKAESKLSKKSRRKRDVLGNVIGDALSDIKKGFKAGKEVETTSSTGRINIIKQELEKRAKEGDKNAIKQLKKFGERFKENMKVKRKENEEIDKKLGK